MSGSTPIKDRLLKILRTQGCCEENDRAFPVYINCINLLVLKGQSTEISYRPSFFVIMLTVLAHRPTNPHGFPTMHREV